MDCAYRAGKQDHGPITLHGDSPRGLLCSRSQDRGKKAEFCQQVAGLLSHNKQPREMSEEAKRICLRFIAQTHVANDLTSLYANWLGGTRCIHLPL